ncbi:MAG: Gfo/Idh/MocA family oxidoreductase [Bacteroidales bacterium]|nr:Gfo/Idh/MocA family oxidoreductase [Bacteroidales bacterium]
MNNRKLRMGLIGGGKGAFIGKVHHMAAVLDNEIELVCGAFSSDPEKSKASGPEYKIPESRTYTTYEEMITAEAALPESERMDFVSIVTPNRLHFPAAKMALENGFHVVCDKPLTFTLEEAEKLQQIVQKSGLLFAVTYTYTGYPMVKEARQLVKAGKLGKIRKILVEYPQGWLSENIEIGGNKQAGWRTDPEQSGKSCSMGDIGIHASNLVTYITDLEITQLCADLNTFVAGRKLDDDGSVLLKFNNGAKGVLTASQVCAGEENPLAIRVYGELGGLEWRQMEPNTLILKWPDRAKELVRTGVGKLSEQALAHTRLPAGHPEGYIEAFANIYRNFAYALRNSKAGKKPDPLFDFPDITEGLSGMKFIDKVVESSISENKWTNW